MSNSSSTPTPTVLMTLDDVKALLGFSTSGLYALMRRESGFPLPLKIGRKAIRWRRADLEEWLATRPLATGTGPRKKRGKRAEAVV